MSDAKTQELETRLREVREMRDRLARAMRARLDVWTRETYEAAQNALADYDAQVAREDNATCTP